MDLDLIPRAVEWTTHASREIEKAGGVAEKVLKRFPPDLLNTLVRNGLVLTYLPKE